MPWGQTDPSRLAGEALRQWYSRTPAEIESERRQAAAERYRAFFNSEAGADSDAAANSESSAGNEGGPSPYLVRVAAPRSFSDYWSFRGCQNCHGYTEGSAPHIGPSLFPPTVDPRQGAKGRQGREMPECELQREQDQRTCDRQPTPQYQAICHASKMQRYGTCRATGKMGTPALDTFRRLNTP
jgi:hypothetical protein